MGYNARVCRFLAGTPPSSPASPSVRGRKAQDPAGGIWRSSEPKAHPAPCGAGRKRRGKVRAGSDVRPAPGKPRDDHILKLVGFTGWACVNGGVTFMQIFSLSISGLCFPKQRGQGLRSRPPPSRPLPSLSAFSSLTCLSDSEDGGADFRGGFSPKRSESQSLPQRALLRPGGLPAGGRSFPNCPIPPWLGSTESFVAIRAP